MRAGAYTFVMPLAESPKRTSIAMKLAMIVGVLAALAVANAGSVDIKVQGKAIAITPTEDAWQQLVAPLSEVAFLTPACPQINRLSS